MENFSKVTSETDVKRRLTMRFVKSLPSFNWDHAADYEAGDERDFPMLHPREMENFSKFLSETDVNWRLTLPMKFLKSLPSFNGGHAIEFEARDEMGKAWTFHCSVRRRGHPKPVITRGWMAFINSKKLKMGDRVSFFKYKNRATAETFYEVRAEKAIKIFGAVIGYAPC
ncbi:hypothetical protein SADUNF_Sadunf12G0015700 [Salix dunnii]|uniref:TF-B3 domain-containing protein n=1 Tax=Salix dunnii TaxID=1413687 RepID=A0A835JH48_9ROSI|nr:hypothetical protein SADUNF_Sadunf12G0015700 [Salix dunnii]